MHAFFPKKKQKNKYREKFVILQLIGIMAVKSKETRAAAYTCRYSSEHSIPLIQSCQDGLGIKCLLIFTGVDDCPCFLPLYSYDPY